MSNNKNQSTPLRMSLADVSKANQVTVRVVFVGLLGFVCLATFITARANSERKADAITARTDSTVAEIDERMSTYSEVLYGVRNDFEHEEDVDRLEFNRIIQRLNVGNRWPGVQVIGAAHVASSDELDKYELSVNRSADRPGLDYPNFSVYPSPDAQSVLAIDYIEPQLGNEKAFGFDFFSEQMRQDAAHLARDTDRPAATGPITLVQETGEQRAILVMLPTYAMGAPISTPEERRNAFDGVVYAAFRMGDLISGTLGDNGPSSVSVLDIGTGEILYGDLPAEDLIELDPQVDNRVRDISVSGRRWRVLVDDDSPVLSSVERVVPAATFVGGLFATLLFLALASSMRSARSKAITLASEMTYEIQALTESASEGIVTIDESGSIVAWNRGAAEIYGAEAEEALGQDSSRLVPPKFRAEFRRLLRDAISNRRDGAADLQVTGTCCRFDGTEFPADLSISSWSARGQLFITGFTRDITARVEAERLIQETSDMLKGVLEAATSVAIVGTDIEGTITLFNSGAERMLGFTAEEMVGLQTPAAFHDPDEIKQRAEELGITPGFDVFTGGARSGMAERQKWTHVAKDGTRIPVEITVTARYGTDGELCGFIGVAHDISERIRVEAIQQERLEQQRHMVAKLTELDEVKNDFVSTMSHELRTPLTSIIGFAELLAEELSRQTTSEQSLPMAEMPMVEMPMVEMPMVEMIEKNARRLLALVENLLQLSKIESGAFQLGRSRCEADAIIVAAVQAIYPLAAGREIKIAVDAATGAVLDGDEQQLERLFLNLLSNAVKFSDRGGLIEVRAVMTDVWTVSITDHGIGIPADEQDRLFTRFFRSRSASAMQIPGTGLGLSIVANIVEFHGGTIRFESNEGVGTTFTVSLPLERAQSETQQSETQQGELV